MDFSALTQTLTPDMIERFMEAVETGKWPDGTALSEQQKETCIQSIMIYQARLNETSDEPFTITKDGELVTGKKVREDFPGQSSNERVRETFKIDPSLIIPNKNKH